MKKILSFIWNLIVAIGEAKYAANLAYNHKIKEAQAVYKD